ncbi:MAG: 1-acyl-sn-glycerol-3-phosphate acyltransferase [Candidatus Rokubacteria bacterium]|nr:1-acyl-sn-glycerol-3-phosphate acyltransferase [Candidatus Rokubacteria bacterium]
MSRTHGQTPSASPPASGSLSEAAERLPALYGALRSVLRPVLRRFFDFRVSGLEHLPHNGPFIVVANHANYLDGVVLGAALPRKIVFLVMPRVYHATPLHPYFHRHIGSIPIELARPDPGAIRCALRVLEDGGVVGIFPEGPFGRDGQLVHGQPGAALVALRAQAPVVPAAITGTFQALVARRWYIPRRVPLRVSFGRALRFTSPRRPLTQRVREDVTSRIMAEIAALLADEPRLPAPVTTPAGGP